MAAASRTFGVEDQARFAALTGDFNPMHMDSVAARRTHAGAPVVHGIHTLLWLLDTIATRHIELPNIATLKVRFRKMVYLGDRVDAKITQLTADTLRAQASIDGVEVVSLSAGFGSVLPESELPMPALAKLLIRQTAPCELTLQDMEGRSGRVAFGTAPAEMESVFPNAARLLGARRIAALGCSTYLVGMVVPGLHSIYGGFSLSVTADTHKADELCFAVTSVDSRMRLVQLAITGAGLAGSLDTFNRVPPVLQAPIDEVATLVGRQEFDASISLVVGGSRGLGEITAKLIAAGGGRVIITYATGKTDAEKLVAEINSWGGHCEAIAYDVRHDAHRQLEALMQPPTHLYYFATPTISRRKSGLFARKRFEEFNDFYVHGFLQLVEAGLHLRPEGIAAFYPSSVFVQDRQADMTEYAMSKAAGEILCADMSKYWHGVRVITQRLPRLPTDQTASLIAVKTASPLSIMLPIIRKMHVP